MSVNTLDRQIIGAGVRSLEKKINQGTIISDWITRIFPKDLFWGKTNPTLKGFSEIFQLDST